MLRKLRREHGLTMRALGARVGVSAAYVNDVEHGHRSGTAGLAAAVAVAFGLDAKPLHVAVALDTGKIHAPEGTTEAEVWAAVEALWGEP